MDCGPRLENAHSDAESTSTFERLQPSKLNADSHGIVCEEVSWNPSGYPRLAAFQNSDPAFSIFRRFRSLHSRAILSMQEELRILEKNLEVLEALEFRGNKTKVKQFRNNAHKGNSVRMRLPDEIDAKLRQYDHLLQSKKRSPSIIDTTRIHLEDDFDKAGAKLADASWATLPASTHGHTSRKSGLRMVVNGEHLDAFGDTGSSHNIIDEAYVQTHGLQMDYQGMHLPQGDKSTLFSPGTVELEVAFNDDPRNPIRILARVVREFQFDLLLGNGFLRKTKTLTAFFHRFKTCVFPRLTSRMSFHFVGHITERFNVTLNDSIEVGATLDTGSSCNVVDYRWAKRHGFHIETGDESRGWIFLPSGCKATRGQVNTTMTLQDGQIVPLTLDVLKDCVANLVLGDEIIFKYKLYDEIYSDSFSDNGGGDFDNALLHMDYRPWYLNVLEKAKGKYRELNFAQNAIASANDADELERQWNWDQENCHGRGATVDEWMGEYYRREKHEKTLYLNVSFQDKVLIRYIPDELVLSVGESPFDPHTAPIA